MRAAREERGITLREMASRVQKIGWDISYSALAQKERGGIKITPPERKYIAQALDMTLDEFDALWRASRIERTDGDESGKNGIPVINRAPAGMVVDYHEYGVDSGQGHTYIDRGNIDDPFAFAVIVVGDSMEPELREGDYVIFSPMNVPKPRAKLEPGKVVFIRVGQDAKNPGCCIARFDSADGQVLKFTKDNKKHKAITVNREHIEQLSVMVQMRRDF